MPLLPAEEAVSVTYLEVPLRLQTHHNIGKCPPHLICADPNKIPVVNFWGDFVLPTCPNPDPPWQSPSIASPRAFGTAIYHIFSPVGGFFQAHYNTSSVMHSTPDLHRNHQGATCQSTSSFLSSQLLLHTTLLVAVAAAIHTTRKPRQRFSVCMLSPCRPCGPGTQLPIAWSGTFPCEASVLLWQSSSAPASGNLAQPGKNYHGQEHHQGTPNSPARGY